MTWHRMRETSSDSRSGICCNPIKNSVQASASERVIKHDLFVQARAIPHYRAATLHDGYVKVANFGAAGPFPLNANQATARQLNDLIPCERTGTICAERSRIRLGVDLRPLGLQ